MNVPSFSGLLMLVVAVLSLLQPSNALPTPASLNDTATPTTPLVRRECTVATDALGGYRCNMDAPTLPQMVSHMQDPAYKGKVSDESVPLFYTNMKADRVTCYLWILGWLKSQKIDHHYYSDNAVDFRWSMAQQTWLVQHRDAFKDKYPDHLDPVAVFHVCYCQALAVAAKHPTVYLFIPKGVEPEPASLWLTVKLPALTLNLNVKAIYRVDPRPPHMREIKPGESCGYDDPVLIWSRARGDATITTGNTCPRK